MNREIKFRAWSFHNKEMYQGNSPFPAAYCFQIYGNGNIGYCPTFAEDLMSFYTDADAENEHLKIAVMQFTGLHDKNGKEIYEGDILMYSSDGYVYNNGDVIFSDGCFTCRGTFFRQLSIAVCPLFKIIGNIYENPELIK